MPRKRRDEDEEQLRDELAMRLLSFPEEHHELVRRLHYVPLKNKGPAEAHEAYLRAGLEYYILLNVMPPREFQRIVLWALLGAEKLTDDYVAYVAQRI